MLLGIIIRILIPLALGYWLSRIIMSYLKQRGQNTNLKDHPEKDNVIDICPECGQVKDKNHRCPDD